MGVQIVDCTIRDGGYLLSKNPDSSYVKGIICGLQKAGIDYVETGFLQDQSNGESLVYRCASDMHRVLPAKIEGTEYLGFCDNSRYSIDNLETCDGKTMRWLRISFAKHEMQSALLFADAVQSKGYKVQFNPMDAISYTSAERKALVEAVNHIKPACLSIVDTFGAMYVRDLREIFNQIDGLLDESIQIGLHSHDNMGLSCALAEEMISMAEQTGRDVLVDGSLFGMGRGAGNAKTELLADYINKFYGGTYDIAVLLDVIDEYIIPLLKSIHWGYDLPMYMCGTLHAHVDNVYHLQKKNCTIHRMYEVMKALKPEDRIRYGVSYRKDDFEQLDSIFSKEDK